MELQAVKKKQDDFKKWLTQKKEQKKCQRAKI